MKPTWEHRLMKLYRIGEHPVAVTGRTDYTPHYRRVHFAAPDAVASLDVFPTQWFRLWVDHPQVEGTTQRAYTFVNLDPGAGTFSADFVLHEPTGPGGEFGAHASAGDVTSMSLTPARVKMPEGTDHLIVCGDLSALPAINSWRELLPPKVSIEAFVLSDGHDTDALPVVAREGGSITWVDGGAEDLARTMGEQSSARSGTFAWGAGERHLVKAVRGVFTEVLGLSRREQFSQAYWTRGKAAT